MLKLRQIDRGVNFSDSENKVDCIPCVTGKLARQPFPLSKSRASKYGRSFCHPDSSVFDARVPLFSSLGRRTGGQLRRSLWLYQLMTTRPIIFHLYTLQLSLTLLRQHYPSKRPFTPRPSFELPSNPFFSTLPFRQLISLRGRFRPRPDGTYRWPLLASLSTKEGRECSIT
jgi:hypothetical protein